ncbi:MAG: ABC transporter substrate-binding protein [Terriglobales bacterium]|jgi:branched-chain amino acid transport system substrate-binding protein
MLIFGFIRKVWNCGWACALLMACSLVTLATAQAPGVSDRQIKIGSCAVLDGPNRLYGIQIVLGATAYFDYINDHGGVNGRKLGLSSFDDGYDPERTSACFASLMREKVFAAGFFFGSATTAKYLPLLEAEHMPLVGTYSGAPFIYEPVKHGIFNLRASYNDETRELVDNLWRADARRIGVIYQDDAFGKTVLDSATAALAKHKATPAAVGAYTRNALDVGSAIEAVHAAKPEVVILATTYAAAAEIVKRAHGQGWRPLFVSGSYIGTDAFITVAGKEAEGVVSMQIVPPYDATDLPAVRLYRECLEKYMSRTQPSPTSLEAFVNAMVIVEALKRAGKDPTREKFIAAIESMNGMDIGLGPEARLEFRAQHHKGLSRVYPTVVRNGKPEAFSNWAVMLARK